MFLKGQRRSIREPHRSSTEHRAVECLDGIHCRFRRCKLYKPVRQILLGLLAANDFDFQWLSVRGERFANFVFGAENREVANKQRVIVVTHRTVRTRTGSDVQVENKTTRNKTQNGQTRMRTELRMGSCGCQSALTSPVRVRKVLQRKHRLPPFGIMSCNTIGRVCVRTEYKKR
jgi:hypothetical protein